MSKNILFYLPIDACKLRKVIIIAIHYVLTGRLYKLKVYTVYVLCTCLSLVSLTGNKTEASNLR